MDDNDIKTTFTKDNVPEEEDSTIELDNVKLNQTWTFWETYEQKSSLDYKDSIKNICNFSDIISFWQFWNNYPGSNFSEVFFDGELIK